MFKILGISIFFGTTIGYFCYVNEKPTFYENKIIFFSSIPVFVFTGI